MVLDVASAYEQIERRFGEAALCASPHRDAVSATFIDERGLPVGLSRFSYDGQQVGRQGSGLQEPDLPEGVYYSLYSLAGGAQTVLHRDSLRQVPGEERLLWEVSDWHGYVIGYNCGPVRWPLEWLDPYAAQVHVKGVLGDAALLSVQEADAYWCMSGELPLAALARYGLNLRDAGRTIGGVEL